MKRYFITFGAGNFSKRVKILEKQAKEVNWFDDVIIETPETISSFIDEHKGHFKNKRGFGYYLWKPYIILRQLEKMSDGDLLFYTDSGATILPHRKNRFIEYVNLLESSDTPILTFPIPSNPKSTCYKTSLLKRFNLEGNNYFLESDQIESGVLCLRKCQYSINIIKEWLDVMIEDNYIYSTDELLYEEQLKNFTSYRHDQSVLCIICKYNSAHEMLSEAYGSGPFFSSRLTDSGPREFAPDFFRGEPDYLPGVHHLVEDWLKDKPKNWWKFENDYNPNIHLKEWDYVLWRAKIDNYQNHEK